MLGASRDSSAAMLDPVSITFDDLISWIDDTDTLCPLPEPITGPLDPKLYDDPFNAFHCIDLTSIDDLVGAWMI